MSRLRVAALDAACPGPCGNRVSSSPAGRTAWSQSLPRFKRMRRRISPTRSRATIAKMRIGSTGVYIVEDGGIDDGDMLKVSYVTAAAKRARAQTKSPPEEVFAAVRFVEDATDAGRNVYIRRASLGSGGDFAVQGGDRTTPQSFQLSIGVLEPGGADAAVIIDGRVMAAA